MGAGANLTRTGSLTRLRLVAAPAPGIRPDRTYDGGLAQPAATIDEKGSCVQDDPPDGIAPTTQTEEDPTSGRSRALLLGAPLLVVLAGLAAFFALRDEAPPPTTADSTTSASTTTSTTTTTIPVLPAGTFEVATAKPSVNPVRVQADEPEGWSTSALAVEYEELLMPPASAGTMPERPALPRIDYPVAGRTAVVGGWEFSNPGPYEPAQPFTMLVSERRGDWIKVHVPVRPNSVEGWVRRADVELSTVRHRIEVRLGERVLRLYEGDRELLSTPVVVGAPHTPTPTGVFYVTDEVPQPNPNGAYGPIALATDGYSEAMDYFSTGVPVIALHGTRRPELVGQAVANGCVRVPNDAIQAIANAIPLGTPVLIWP